MHSLGFQVLPEHSPGSGKGVVAEAQRSTSCNKISYIPIELGASHWDAVLVGANEIMTPCVRRDFYGESVSVYVCLCVYVSKYAVLVGANEIVTPCAHQCLW